MSESTLQASLRRTRDIYRRIKPPVPLWLAKRALDVEVLPILGDEEYRRLCPPLAPGRVPVATDYPLEHYASVGDVLRNESIQQYFRVDQDASTIHDDYEDSHYFSRQRMLTSAYKHFIGDTLEGCSVLDMGCSSGYYSFYTARMGAESTLGIDARPEHAEQFGLLRKSLGIDEESCRYRAVDVEYDLGTVEQTFDLVLAQGLMYHLYDHVSFMRHLSRLTGRVLVLESLCSGDLAYMCRGAIEDTANLRMGVHGPALVPSLPWIARLMRWAGFSQIHYVPLPPGIKDRWGFRRWYRVLLVGVKDESAAGE